MSRRPLWLQLLIGWLPVWALFTSLILAAHANTNIHGAAVIALRVIIAAALLSVPAQRFTERVPWQRPARVSFVALHLLAACVYSVAWLGLNSVIESVMRGRFVIVLGPGIAAYLMMGVWLYVMIAGVSYTTFATERAARAEAEAAKSQLAALRSQLNPHFLFNALHAVVQLIPREPKRAAQAAEQLAELLRVAIEDDRDLVPLADEWLFVERYLELERLRFGDRLLVRAELSEDAKHSLIPLFALQTLVENAVRHGAAPKVDPTEITIRAETTRGTLVVTVRDSGVGTTAAQTTGNGTGLRRLRERLNVLYGADARLDTASEPAGDFLATLVLPRTVADA